MEEININEKIREIISHYKLSDRQFCLKIGINPSVLGSMFQKGTEPSAKVIKLTLSAFTDISAEWLLRGAGNMLLSDNQSKDESAERITMLVDTITTLQATINEKTRTIQSLEETNKKLTGELAMLKNERKIG